ncbi:hypothetical protein GJ496_005025 [Pomphorhynchus laevis]|nr:hypothetical protein GJ496_005025 [Pomphorhynchus laevis]
MWTHTIVRLSKCKRRIDSYLHITGIASTEVSERDISTTEAYSHVIGWMPNLVSVPLCNLSRRIIDLIASKYTEIAHTGREQLIALKETLERRLHMWEGESYKELMDEAHVLQSMAVQKRTSSSNNPKTTHTELFLEKCKRET